MADNWLEKLFSYEEYHKLLDVQTEYFKGLLAEYLNKGGEETRGKIKGIQQIWFLPLEKIEDDEVRKRLKQELKKRIAKIEIEVALT